MEEGKDIRFSKYRSCEPRKSKSGKNSVVWKDLWYCENVQEK